MLRSLATTTATAVKSAMPTQTVPAVAAKAQGVTGLGVHGTHQRGNHAGVILVLEEALQQSEVVSDINVCRWQRVGSGAPYLDTEVRGEKRQCRDDGMADSHVRVSEGGQHHPMKGTPEGE